MLHNKGEVNVLSHTVAFLLEETKDNHVAPLSACPLFAFRGVTCV